jgi:hypothetical protein
MDIYYTAWKMLHERIKSKATWDRNELVAIMLQCLTDALDQENKDRIIELKGVTP